MIFLYRIGMMGLVAYGLYGYKAALLSVVATVTFLLTKDVKFD